MASLALGVRFVPASSGTGDFTYASTVTGYRNPTTVLTNSKVYRYRAESADLSEWEFGTGVYSTSTNTLSRNTITASSTGSKVSFTAAPQVAITLDVPDVLQFDDAMTLTQSQQAQGRSNLNIPVQGYLFGATLSTAGISTTFSVAAGAGADSTGVDLLTLGSSINKTTSAWAVGTGNGALDTGAIATSTWYHVYLIKRTDTGVVDVLISLSATSPTLPTNYSLFRRIGSMATNGSSQWAKFVQVGDEFLWDTWQNNASAVATSTSASLLTLSVPTNIKVNALVWARFDLVSGSPTILFSSPDASDQAPSLTVGTMIIGSTATVDTITLNIRTNTSAQIRVRASSSTGTYTATTIGWIDSRGRLA